MQISPGLLKFLINIYGPYLGAGVRVEYISPDWRTLEVSMKLRWYTRNAVGVHFGGSLYSMVDPHLMLMYMQLLGQDYIVWDKSAAISFLRPGKGKVSARFHLSEDDIRQAITATSGKMVYEPTHVIDITNEENNVVARVNKELHIRRKAA